MDPRRHDSGHKMAPVFKKWGYWYLFVLVVLVVLIGLFYLFTKYFS